ncbi:MAG TPA: Zn-dependent hydrolase [Bryobacteraceae bacterium]|nr:Zn-dependent hydrolase [Bryobacteraceae bacterium]
MTRGQFLASLALAPFARATVPAINAERLRQRLEELSVHGRPPGGAFADGVSRVAFSDADVAGRALVMRWMREAHLDPAIDAAGNIFGRRAGSERNLEPVLFGSHIDSVPNGGNFDGDLGVLAAIEAVETLNALRIATKRPLDVVVWTNEEGVAFNNGIYGSRAVAGLLDPGELDHVWNGVVKRDAIRKIGGNPDRIETARRAPGSFHAYLELHIEQGGTLERDGIPIGVVEGIVAIDRYDVEIRGFANHAGTTPMPERKDAFLAAAELTVAVNEIVRAEPGRQVGTVGHIEISPNAPNVVPGNAKLTIELRDLSAEKIARLAAAIEHRARKIAGDTQTSIEMHRASHHDSALADSGLQKTIEDVSARLNLKTRRLPSGAGHDAQSMAHLGRMAMIFVPSVAGISHSPKELTRWEDCANGAAVLLETVRTLAQAT